MNNISLVGIGLLLSFIVFVLPYVITHSCKINTFRCGELNDEIIDDIGTYYRSKNIIMLTFHSLFSLNIFIFLSYYTFHRPSLLVFYVIFSPIFLFIWSGFAYLYISSNFSCIKVEKNKIVIQFFLSHKKNIPIHEIKSIERKTSSLPLTWWDSKIVLELKNGDVLAIYGFDSELYNAIEGVMSR